VTENCDVDNSLAVLVVHHARKSAGNMRAGQALRGSSEFHAWGDSNLYLRRSGDELNLTVEHRAAPFPPSIALELAQRGDALALEVVQPIAVQSLPPSSVDERIVSALIDADRPLPIAELRPLCRVRKARLYARLTELVTFVSRLTIECLMPSSAPDLVLSSFPAICSMHASFGFVVIPQMSGSDSAVD
jgi:hypothetical protein